LRWVMFDEAIKLFSKVNTPDQFGAEINKRDLGFLKKAKAVLHF